MISTRPALTSPLLLPANSQQIKTRQRGFFMDKNIARFYVRAQACYLTFTVTVSQRTGVEENGSEGVGECEKIFLLLSNLEPQHPLHP